MPAPAFSFDRAESAARIAADIEKLSKSPFTEGERGVVRHAYTASYERTREWLRSELEALGFRVSDRPLGTVVGRNVPDGTSSVGIGSHLDSVRDGGAWDGALGVVLAVEVARASAAAGLGLSLTVVAWLEEEGAGFGQMLLGSRLAVGAVTERQLREQFRSLDDGSSFWQAAEAAGYAPARWRESSRALEGVVAWVEPHIEQGRVLEDTGAVAGVVSAIAGYAQADLFVEGRRDHAGATPMDQRVDALAVAAEAVLAAERAAARHEGTTATVGELSVEPGIINVVPSAARMTVDVRSVSDDARDEVLASIVAAAETAARRRGAAIRVGERQRRAAVALSPEVVRMLGAAASECGVPWRLMSSGATHDTACLAPRIPSAMLFVPCREGVSHSPDEQADPAHAATAVEILLRALAAMDVRARR